MCGICGYIAEKKLQEGLLQKMNDTMYHRGPNDAGVYEAETKSGFIGVAQRRLSILDLSPLGHQPMFSQDGKLIIVYNGEIYNFKELRKELEKCGYEFQSTCDTEVLLAAYEEWGENCFTKLNGMFAAAIYENDSNRLILVRDRMGKKPLYYYWKGNTFLFASELKPIMACPLFDKQIDKRMLEKLLCNKYIEAPYTIFEQTHKLAAGTYLIYENGQVQTKEYWNPVKAKENGISSKPSLQLEEAVSELDSVLTDAVSKRMIADVPIGTFLSGGIDSALITAIAQKVSERPVKSFSIGFYDKERNEAQYAAEIARHIGTSHKEQYVGEAEIFEMLKDLPKYYDEPFSDSSQLPTMLVSKMASKDITVALTGDGGDELFCGYKMYDWTYIAQRVDWIGACLYHIPGIRLLEDKIPAELSALIENRNPDYKTQLYVDVMVAEVKKILGKEAISVKYPQESSLKYKDWQERRMLLDMMTYLPDEVLAKTDRASMKYSMEVRCPLLDYRVVEQALQIPQKLKYTKGQKKYILKELTYRYIPRELMDRPKNGFGVPLRKWLRTVLKKEIMRYADPQKLDKQGIFVPDAIQNLVKKQAVSDKIVYSSILWSFYVFQRWYQVYIEDLWS